MTDPRARASEGRTRGDPAGRVATDGGDRGGDGGGRTRDADPESDVPAPQVPVDEDWRRVEATLDTPFDAGVVTVRAHTVVYEDAVVRERVRERTGADALWRFVFASRLALRPRTPTSAALTRLVRNRSEAGFVDQLRERGFEAVDRDATRRFRVGDVDTKLTRYDARLSVAGVELAVEGWVTVWPAQSNGDPGYLLAGGAYPTTVEATADGDGTDGTDPATALREELVPGTFREELFSLIRATE
jgi:hypothetical protein